MLKLIKEGTVSEYSSPPPTGFVGAIKKGFRGYVIWNARSTRSEFWWWTLFIVIVLIVAEFLEHLPFLENIDLIGSGRRHAGPLTTPAMLVFFLPSLSIYIRRLHDTDRTGWWAWLWLITIIGWIVSLIFAVLPSKMGPTRWNNRISQ